ncbi:MAG: O-antigen ligase family protein [Labilithrix sp.]|nr:O-antigen ligase family protein [Labilithrix sp.]
MRFGAERSTTVAGKWLLAFVVPASALALGSLLAEVLIVMVALAALACGLLWLECVERMSRATAWVLIAAAILLGMTTLQAIPLPADVVRVLAPANADIWERALSPLREAGPRWHPISVAPVATRVEIARGVFYVCVFLAALRVMSLEKGERFLERIVIVSTTCFVLSALAHGAMHAERVFGLYEPREAYAFAPGRRAPLLNPNHLAAYLNIGACVSIGALLTRRTLPRALTTVAALLLVATSVWAGSRGGMGGLFLGVAFTVGLTMYVRRRFRSAGAEMAILAMCLLVGGAMLALGVSDAPREELGNRDVGKLAVALNTLDLVPSSSWFGYGRGAFETVFPAVRRSTGYLTFTHPENIVAQWTIEWGVPAAVAGAGALMWALRPNVVLGAVRPPVGPWAAIVAAVISDLVDFHLEVPGIVALVAVCVALVVGGRSRVHDPRRARATALRRVALVCPVLSLGVIASVLPHLSHSLADERRTVGAMAIDPMLPGDSFRASIRNAMLRHPGESFFPLMGAVRAQQTGEESVVPWVARALERNPGFGRAHLVLARSLAAKNPSQARLEYRLAYESDLAGLGAQVMAESVRLIDDVDGALELVPAGAAGVEMLEALVTAVRQRLPSTAAALDRELERRAPSALGPVRRRAEAVLSDVSHDHPWCADRAPCLSEGTAAAKQVVAREPTRCSSHTLVARLTVQRGETTAALDQLERVVDTVADRADCQRQLIVLALERGEKRRAERVLERLVRGGCGRAAECAELYSWAAGVEESRGNHNQAIALYRRVVEVAPEREDVIEHVGDLAMRAGLNGEALQAYATLARRHPDDVRWQERVNEVKARTMERAFAPDRLPSSSGGP